MLHGKRLAVVVPAFNEESQVEGVLNRIPGFVDGIIVVDDCSGDETATVAENNARDSPRLRVIRHEINRGVGAAIESGYRAAVDEGIDLIAVMAGDGQMPPDDLQLIAEPVALGQADYAKANRLADFRAWRFVPKTRLLGNLGLSIATQAASGYWGCWDSQTGFTVISREAAAALLRLGVYPRYGCPNDILIKLSGLGYRVTNVPSRPVYGVGEVSKLRVRKVAVSIPPILLRGMAWRMWYRYVRRGDYAVPSLLLGSVVAGAVGAISRRPFRLRLALALAIAGAYLDGRLTNLGAGSTQRKVRNVDE